jgi:hypothetical protein
MGNLKAILSFIEYLDDHAASHGVASDKLHALSEILASAEEHVEVFHPYIEAVQYAINVLDHARASSIEHIAELCEKHGIQYDG